MEDLDNSWILLNNEVDCRNNDDNSPATLGLKNMRGVFILVSLKFRRITRPCFATRKKLGIRLLFGYEYQAKSGIIKVKVGF